jgi:uncharacterized MAPEG superfamily protein
MLKPLVCLVAFALWSVALVSCIGLARVTQVLTGKKRANEFPSGTPHGGDLYWRLNRAHLNTLENLPIFAVLVLTGTWLRLDSWFMATLPTVVLAARLVQSLVHISSGSSRAVTVRFTAFATQVTCFVVLGVHLLLHLM